MAGGVGWGVGGGAQPCQRWPLVDKHSSATHASLPTNSKDHSCPDPPPQTCTNTQATQTPAPMPGMPTTAHQSSKARTHRQNHTFFVAQCHFPTPLTNPTFSGVCEKPVVLPTATCDFAPPQISRASQQSLGQQKELQELHPHIPTNCEKQSTLPHPGLTPKAHPAPKQPKH
jgi:hypothetical protein